MSKHAHDLVLLAKGETALQGMTSRLTEIGKCCGMETNGEKRKVMRISRQPSPVQITIDQKQLENVKYLDYLGSVMTSHARCARVIKSRIARAKAAFKKEGSFHQQTGLKYKEEINKILQWSIALYDAEKQTLGKVDQKYLRSFEIWCWRRIEKIS
jgi:hypothetical protein